MFRPITLACFAPLLFIACAGESPPLEPGMVTGALEAPPGRSLRGTRVLACPPGDVCETLLANVLIEADAPDATFTLRDLPEQDVIVIAWSDANANGELDAGDLAGTYTRNGSTPAIVRAPADRVDIALVALREDGAPAIPPELVGFWQDPTYLIERNPNLYDPATGAWLDDYDGMAGSGVILRADGTYVWGQVAGISNGGCHSVAMDFTSGRAEVAGDWITLFPSVHREYYEGGCNSASDYDRDASTEPRALRWRRETLSGGRTGLVLVEEDGTPHTYGWVP